MTDSLHLDKWILGVACLGLRYSVKPVVEQGHDFEAGLERLLPDVAMTWPKRRCGQVRRFLEIVCSAISSLVRGCHVDVLIGKIGHSDINGMEVLVCLPDVGFSAALDSEILIKTFQDHDQSA